MSARVRHLILNRIPDARTLSRTQLSLSPSAPVAIGGADLSFAARAAGWSRSGTPSGSIPAASATAPRCRSGQRTADCGLRTADCGLRTADCGLRTARFSEWGLRLGHLERRWRKPIDDAACGESSPSGGRFASPRRPGDSRPAGSGPDEMHMTDWSKQSQ